MAKYWIPYLSDRQPQLTLTGPLLTSVIANVFISFFNDTHTTEETFLRLAHVHEARAFPFLHPHTLASAAMSSHLAFGLLHKSPLTDLAEPLLLLPPSISLCCRQWGLSKPVPGHDSPLAETF